MSNIMHICCACKQARGTHEYHDETLDASHWYCDRCNEGWLTTAIENAEVIMTMTRSYESLPRSEQYNAWLTQPPPGDLTS